MQFSANTNMRDLLMFENEHSLFGLVFSYVIYCIPLCSTLFLFSLMFKICWRNILTLVCFSGDVSLPNARFFFFSAYYVFVPKVIITLFNVWTLDFNLLCCYVVYCCLTEDLVMHMYHSYSSFGEELN